MLTMLQAGTSGLRLDISSPNNAGRLVIRWIEDRTWGPNTLLITTCLPEDAATARSDFDLFCQVSPERRGEAVCAVRHSSLPSKEVLASFLPVKESQPSLF